MPDVIEFSLLGPPHASVGNRSFDLGPAKQQCVLAVLLVHANQAVSVDALIHSVWQDTAPATARNVIYNYITRNRHTLSRIMSALRHGSTAPAGALGIGRSTAGYVLRADPDHIDLHRFRRLVAAARSAPGGSPGKSAELLRDALRLWRGEPLQGIRGSWALGIRENLQRERNAAILACYEAELKAGRHGELVDELEQHAAAHPFDEAVLRQLLVALHRSGRRTEALQYYETTRRRLSRELGLDPSAETLALHQRILRDSLDSGPACTAPRFPTPAQLPAGPFEFVGRQAELDELGVAARTGRGAPTLVIEGAAGAGKSALTVHWGHRVKQLFPDGQLYANLRGHCAEPPTAPREVLSRFLRSFGLRSTDLPDDLDELSSLYRSALAGRRVLVVLDDAAGTDQVTPLLPGGAHCATVITSRMRLDETVARHGVRRLGLGVLTSAEATELLGRVIGADRVSAEPDAARELCRGCGHLPLLLRLLGTHLTSHPGLPLSEVDSGAPLFSRPAHLELLRKVFGPTYRALDPVHRRFLRQLAVTPAEPITVATAARLTGLSPGDAASALDTLAAVHVVEVHPAGGYLLHDVWRGYPA